MPMENRVKVKPRSAPREPRDKAPRLPLGETMAGNKGTQFMEKSA